MEKIKFLDLSKINSGSYEEYSAILKRVINSESLILGASVDKFEEEFANYVGSKYCVSVGSGLDALYFILKSYGIGEGDQVIVPAQTFIATWLAVTRTGAVPIPVDIELEYNCIDLLKVEDSCTNRTKAVVAVNLYGCPCELDSLQKLCSEKGIKLIQDAAQSHGSIYGGRKIAQYGDGCAWSFYPGKNLGALGDGGAITTDNRGVYEYIRAIRNYGSQEKYIHKSYGYNSRLDTLQAAILREKLCNLEHLNGQRELIASIYNSVIDNNCIVKPGKREGDVHSWHLYVIRTDERERLIRYLAIKGIETMIHYPTPPYRQEIYKKMCDGKVFTLADIQSKTCLSLPIGPHLTTKQAEYIAYVINMYR